MMEDDREKIFASIRKGLRQSERYSAERSSKSPLLDKLGPDFLSLFEKFRSELKTLGGEAVSVQDEAEAFEQINTRSHANEALFIYEEIKSKYALLTSSLSERKSVKFQPEFSHGYDRHEAAKFTGVVTGCYACVAETGTVILRTAMRLPAALATQLFVVASGADLRPSLDQIFTEDTARFGGSNLFLVTGPSRTADIEKQLVTGVHGPKDVFVIFMKS